MSKLQDLVKFAILVHGWMKSALLSRICKPQPRHPGDSFAVSRHGVTNSASLAFLQEITESLEGDGGHPGKTVARKPQVEVLQVSLNSLASVHRFCEGFNSRKEPLNILILNAGIMASDSKRRETEDGLEEHFQVGNCL